MVVNVIATSLLLMKPAVECQCLAKKPLPCESVPISWAVTHYDCANSLLLSMNVTNVKFKPPRTADQIRKSNGSIDKVSDFQ